MKTSLYTFEDLAFELTYKNSGGREGLSNCWSLDQLSLEGHNLIQGLGVISDLHKVCKGKLVIFKCNNPKCIRPDHLIIKDKLDRRKKLTLTQVREIIKRYKTGCCTQTELAEEFKVSQGHIHNIVMKKQWRDHPEVKSI